jgi:tRNA-Thr(GGU) m(6)t(6)A37 methyltransferase TsaA
MHFTFESIGSIRTSFREKFGVPRQSLMANEARGVIKLNPDKRYRDAVTGLQTFSHVWLIFVFDRDLNRGWHPLVETPRVDADRIGVFASRSPHRPNSIGMSVVRLERIDSSPADGIEIHVSGIDLLDGTAILDIKPYLPYADAVTEANAGWASNPIPKFVVTYSNTAQEKLKEISCKHPRFHLLLQELLELDPRPTSQRRAAPIETPASNDLPFAFRLMEYDIHWTIRDGTVHVLKILDL